MDDFVLAVARYLEKNDSSLTPIQKKTLYPPLDPQPSAPSDYENFTRFSVDPTPPQANSAPLPTHTPVQVIHNHYHTRSESAFYRQPIIVNQVPSTTVFVQREQIVPKEKPAKDKEEKEKQDASPWLGAAVLATGTVATTVAVCKLALAKKELDELLDERKKIRMVLISDDEEKFINQFDETFAELKKSSTFMTGSVFSGGGSALLIGSMLFSGASSDIASAVAVFSGCGAIAAACYAYFFVSDDRNTHCKKLHTIAKKIIEKDV